MFQIDAQAFKYGFRVAGDCRKPRRLVDANVALTAYAACDERCSLHSESYLSAFQFGDDFRVRLSTTGSTAKFAGACWSAWIWWDIDAEGDLQRAMTDARRLAGAITSLGLSEDDLLIFFSGSKGFHLGMPTEVWTPLPSGGFHKITRQFAEVVAEQAGANIDSGVYDKVRCFRAPNSRHPKTGLHKRWLSFDELLHLSADAIVKLSAEPMEFEIPAPKYGSVKARALWDTATKQVRTESKAMYHGNASTNTPAKLNRGTLEFIRAGATAGDRHRLCFSAAANLAELGASLQLCEALVEESALDAGLSPNDTARAIANGWESIQPQSAGGDV